MEVVDARQVRWGNPPACPYNLSFQFDHVFMIGGVVTLGRPSQCKQTRSINTSKQADYIVNQFYVCVFRDSHIL